MTARKAPNPSAEPKSNGAMGAISPSSEAVPARRRQNNKLIPSRTMPVTTRAAPNVARSAG